MKQRMLKFVGGALLGLSCSVTASAAAASTTFPVKPVTLIVPFAAGNVADGLARILANSLSGDLGQQVVVENRPGAAGIGAIRHVASAAADGYTLVYIGIGTAISQSLFSTPPYNVEKSFVPVSMFTSNDVLLLTGKNSQLKSVQDVIQEAKAKGDRFTVGVSLIGTLQHLTAELFKSTEGLDYTVIPFKTAANLNSALQRGDIDIVFEYMQPVYGLIESGDLNALAIGNGKQRTPRLPDVPTFTEVGVPGVQVASWGAILAPANTPDAVVQRLNQGIQNVLNNPETKAQLESNGSRILGGTPEEAKEFISSEIVRWGKVIHDAKIQLQ